MFARLQDLQYHIQYRKGADNDAIDAIYHRVHSKHLSAISSVQHKWLEDVVQSYSSSQLAVNLLARLTTSTDSAPPYSLLNGVIRYNNRVWLGLLPQI